MSGELKIKILENPLPFVLGGGLGLAGIYYLRGVYRNRKERKQLSSLRMDRQLDREERMYFLEQMNTLGSPEHVEIVALPFSELVDKLQSRELKARKVMEAFVWKSLVVTRQFNCITEYVPHIFDAADALDALPSVKGPLHGIPICIKDDHNIEGMDSTLGYAKNLYKPAKGNSVVVQSLQDAGAIPFCKTNIPQTEFSYGSNNPIFGTTTNPLNKALGPGGSSSGTGCLVGAGGAPFGAGSDIGGSVRIPAHFCGISTLRSTIGRISGKGVNQCLDLCAGYTGVSGILAPRADTLASVFKIMTADALQNQYDPLAVPLPWNQAVYGSKESLKIGYYTSMPFFPSLGDTPKTVLSARRALESMGHTLVEFDLPDTFNIVKVYATLSGADGGNQIYKLLQHDRVSYVAEKFLIGKTLLSKICLTLSSLFNLNKKTTRNFAGDHAAASSEVLWDYLAKQRDIKYDMLKRMKDLNLDLILAPAFPFPACKLKDDEILLPAVVYTCIWNLVDFPAGVVPFGNESCTNITSYDDEGDYYLKVAKETIKYSRGMPIGVQIIGKPFQEEMVLRILTQLDEYKLAHAVP